MKIPYIVAAVAGVALWIGASMLSGRREAWDAPIYWSAAYPAALVLCALLGGLWPLGLVLFAVLSLPGMLVAYAAAALRNRTKERPNDAS